MRRKTGITLVMMVKLLPRKRMQREGELDRIPRLLPKTTVQAPPPEDPTLTTVSRRRQQSGALPPWTSRPRKAPGQLRVREHRRLRGASRWRPDYENLRFRKGMYLKQVSEPRICLFQDPCATSGF